MSTVEAEALERRCLMSSIPPDQIGFAFARHPVNAAVGKAVAPIVVVAVAGPDDKTVRDFSGPVTLELNSVGTAPIATAEFEHGRATFKGLRFTAAQDSELWVVASGVPNPGLGELIVRPGPVASAKVTNPTFDSATVPPTVVVQLQSYDVYGNATAGGRFILRLGKTGNPAVHAALHADPQSPPPGVIFRNGKPVAVHFYGGSTYLALEFPGATPQEAAATSVQILFSDRKIAPVWTPTADLSS